MRSKDGLELVLRDGSLRRLEGDSAALAEALLELFDTGAQDRASIHAHLEARTGAPLGDGTRVVDALVDLLEGAGVLTRRARALPANRGCARVLLGLGGAVASAHAPALVQALQAMGHEVRVIASERALRFASREALEALTHEPVLCSMWPSDAERSHAGHVPHVELAGWAEVMAIWPATAAMIGRIATGDCSELVSAVAITTRAPVLVAPSMNEAMIDAASVARNLETLKADGFRVALTTLAHEVASAPADRRPMHGGAPDASTVARMIDALARAGAPLEPRDAASWEAFHRRVPESEQAWVGAADPVTMGALAAHGRGGSLWDVGTGHGAIAVAAAERGYRVVATDVSDTALARAAENAPDAAVLWVRDDVTASMLHGASDVVIDRGTLHTLPPASRPGYARTLARRTRTGSIAIITVHTPPGDSRVRTHPMSALDVATLLGPAFELVDGIEGTFAGRLDPAPPSVTCVLRRR